MANMWSMDKMLIKTKWIVGVKYQFRAWKIIIKWHKSKELSPLPGKISRLPVSLFHQARVLNLCAVKHTHINIRTHAHAHTHNHTHFHSVCLSQQTQLSEDQVSRCTLALLSCPAKEIEMGLAGSLWVPHSTTLTKTAKSPMTNSEASSA